MMGLGWQELVIVLIIIMIIFGAGKLPQVAKSLGQGVKEFKEEAGTPIGDGTQAQTLTTATTGSADSRANGAAAGTSDSADATAESERADTTRVAAARETI
jgi:sec-independent protein translocase protein TatA